jgi:hypothetical protein
VFEKEGVFEERGVRKRCTYFRGEVLGKGVFIEIC